MTAPEPSAFDGYVLCTSPRSGSTLLCRLLRQAGLGKPASWFYGPRVEDWLDELNLMPPPQAGPAQRARLAIEAAIQAGRAGGDLFALRQQAHGLAPLRQALALLHPHPPADQPEDAARLRLTFGRLLFVDLRRADKVDQAVSLLKARQTGLWHQAPDGTEIERLAPPAPPVYDAPALHETVETLREHDRAWDAWYAAQRLAPLRLSYDALAADPAGAVRAILRALGRDPAPAARIAPSTRKLADAVSRDWAARYRSAHPEA